MEVEAMKAMIGFLAGVLSGIMIVQGIVVLFGRPEMPGGEILVIPLIAILVIFGWELGKEHGNRKSYQAGCEKGFNEGFEEGFYEGQQTGINRLTRTGPERIDFTRKRL
jgi:hypothetical protein